jgi:formylglycine-generating enzyme
MTNHTRIDKTQAHLRMVLIPEGSFTMGSEMVAAEQPRRTGWIDAIWMDATPVTNAQFRAFVEATHYVTTAERRATRPESDAPPRHGTWVRFAGADRDGHPVVCVSWYDAHAYACWAGKRLPTEAEWEKAARGGLQDALYPWGMSPPDESRVNWQRADSDTIGEVPTVPVGQFKPNAFGLFDMVGHVWHWCADWYDEFAYRDASPINPRGPEHGVYRVRRGGSWNVREAFRLRCANRGAMNPEHAWPNIGFRCVVAADRYRTGEGARS